jgi:hypothetical protein
MHRSSRLVIRMKGLNFGGAADVIAVLAKLVPKKISLFWARVIHGYQAIAISGSFRGRFGKINPWQKGNRHRQDSLTASWPGFPSQYTAVSCPYFSQLR